MEQLFALLTALVVDWSIFTSGVLGGIAAELMRAYRIRVLRRKVEHPVKAWALSIALIILGGLYASRILEVSAHPTAFFAGLTLPLALAVLLRQGVEAYRSTNAVPSQRSRQARQPKGGPPPAERIDVRRTDESPAHDD
jgi:hypothetical protein